MNGATAEILVRISRPPRTIIIRRMGSSQNFFRSRMKDQSSINVDMASSLFSYDRNRHRTQKYLASCFFSAHLDSLQFNELLGAKAHRCLIRTVRCGAAQLGGLAG